MRDDFDALREHDRKTAPSFDAMATRRRPTPQLPRVVYLLPVATAIAMAAAFILWIGAMKRAPAHALAHGPPPVARVDAEPLGFLLDEPAALARLPDFDSTPLEEKR